jgi:hypothetical protein
MASEAVQRVLEGVARMNDPSASGTKDVQGLVTAMAEALATLDERLESIERGGRGALGL